MSVLKLMTSTSRSLWTTSMSCYKNTAIVRQQSTPSKKMEASEVNDWASIYKFPYVELVAAANKLKIYQAAFSVVAVPASFLIPAEMDLVSPLVVAYVGISGFLTLSAASFALKDTVGFIYTSKERSDLVKFSTVDFWGKRKDDVTKIEDVMAFSEMQRNMFDKWITFLHFYNSNRKLKLVYKFGGVYNPTEFMKVFGEER